MASTVPRPQGGGFPLSVFLVIFHTPRLYGRVFVMSLKHSVFFPFPPQLNAESFLRFCVSRLLSFNLCLRNVRSFFNLHLEV